MSELPGRRYVGFLNTFARSSKLVDEIRYLFNCLSQSKLYHCYDYLASIMLSMPSMRINISSCGKTVLLYGLSVVALIVATSVARATTVTLTFEGLQNLEPIDNYYNGGLGGFGSGPGPNYGINFTSDSLALIRSSSGGTGNFSNNPSGSTCAFFLSGAGDTMNIAAGFTTGFSFFYSAVGAGTVTVWSGLNGTGALLGTLNLVDTGNNGPPGGFYNHWFTAGVTFGGTA
jgi:hypothetical protein